jgi:phage gpG-like protein
LLKVVVDATGAIDALGRVPPTVVSAIRAKVRALVVNLQHHIVADKLQGQVLHHRSGALGRSIQTTTTDFDGGAEGKAYSSGDVKYAAIHEFGGQTKPHVIVRRTPRPSPL